MRRRCIALVFAALFVALAILVDVGAFTWLDQYAVDHWMPWLEPASHPLLSFTSIFLPQTVSSTFGSVVDVWTYPASVFPSAVIVAAIVLIRGWNALVWAALWVAANVVEGLGKLIVERPDLHFHGMHVTGFDHSLPSGHTLRSLVIAAAIAATWRVGRAALLWAATIPFALVALGDHTPTDVVAGALAFTALYLLFPRPECR